MTPPPPPHPEIFLKGNFESRGFLWLPKRPKAKACWRWPSSSCCVEQLECEIQPSKRKTTLCKYECQNENRNCSNIIHRSGLYIYISGVCHALLAWDRWQNTQPEIHPNRFVYMGLLACLGVVTHLLIYSSGQTQTKTPHAYFNLDIHTYSRLDFL